jgi:hypothetical protein
MTKRIEVLSKLIPKMSYSADDLSILADMLEDQAYNQMQAQFDMIQMGTKEFKFNIRKIRYIITQCMFSVSPNPNPLRWAWSNPYLELLHKSPRVFLALTMPMENVPLYINRDYLGVFMRWRLLISK